NSQLGPKRIQLLRLLNPRTATIAVLVNPTNPNAADAKAFEDAGRSLGVKIVVLEASTEPEIKEAFNQAAEQHVDALLIHVDALFNDGAGQSQIIALAGQHRVPTMMPPTTFTARGGLISLRRGHMRLKPAGRRLCRPYSARGKACRLAHRTADDF